MQLLTKFSADLPEGASDPRRNRASILLTNRPCRLPPAHPSIKLGRAHASLWIPALTLTPTFSLRVRLITLCEVRNTAGPSHHDLVNGSLLMKSTKYEGRNCAYRCPLDL